MNWDVIENIAAMLTIAAVAVLASHLHIDSALAGSAIAAIAGLAGHGVSAALGKISGGKEQGGV